MLGFYIKTKGNEMVDMNRVEKIAQEILAKINPQNNLIIEMSKPENFDSIEEITKKIRRKKIPFDEKIKEIRAYVTAVAKDNGLINETVIIRNVKGGKTINDPFIDTKTLKKIFANNSKGYLLNKPTPKKKKQNKNKENKKVYLIQ